MRNRYNSEHPLLGTLGAIIGAVIGGASIILCNRLGIVAAISGAILAFCTLKGYELLGKYVTKIGLLICITLIIITPYLADRLDWALLIYEAYSDQDITLVDSFLLVSDFIKEGLIEKSAYIKELILIYVFALFGCYGTLKNMLNP